MSMLGIEGRESRAGEHIKPRMLSRWERYHPKAVLGSLLGGVGRVLIETIPYIILGGALGSISYAVTNNTDLPTLVRVGIGGVLGFGLIQWLKRTPWPDYEK